MNHALAAPASAGLDANAIASACGAAAIDIEVVAETGSTNADLLARAAGLRRPVLRVAVHQTAGRGRAGRSWLSAPGAALTFSLAWHFAGPLRELAGLPLAVGVALADALGALGVPVQLKWPNDVLRDGAKLAGVLIETQAAPGGGVWAVIGIGLNLLMPDEIEERIGRKVAAAPWLAQMDRNALMAQLLGVLAANLGQFAQGGFAPFCARWNRLHAYQGLPVVIIDRAITLHEGVAAGVDDGARLLLDTAGGRIAIVAGDVSLRVREH
ncbi:biotin--[acetyl-CoA-carboxylase] ligase [Massilia antarctica]|uniref:biotin--[acetyl-CoA-carboxylase] ligase n=1 Tax=Massilia antarctica TaxID=2765360 RepID=UPI0006BB5521|nr:biotin--[acetyl-CoA-carboxylase] ligase [Massilia sp. H27-R4]MCY0915901.1 biotin--[acetyl-CoA-carboxylase] ligase [Massilia sp. H27-R4]CUI07315.1 Biotin--protein ligase [Janthinobacterium sp. CG23_2]CUU31101.1 Biotin--protein ligase [Janthinobacterium sp. CG23_2]